MAFFGLFQSGELCASATSGFNMAVTLSPQDVSIDNLGNPQLVKVRLKASKTDPFSESVEVYLARTMDDLCPISAVLAWLSIRGNS